MNDIFAKAVQASITLKTAPALTRSNIIKDIAAFILQDMDQVLKANALDVENALRAGLSPALTDRLTLTKERLESLAGSVLEIAAQPDPVGEVLAGETRPNGLKIVKIRVPMGIVGIIFESRPNVTIDCAALCLRSGNVAILRGGKEAAHSNAALIQLVHRALEKNGFSKYTVVLMDDPDRSKMLKLIQAKGIVDLIIPRGGAGLINFVSENAHVPVIKHDKGICHIYVDECYDEKQALDIIYNAKVSRPGVCNAVETLLIHAKAAVNFLPKLKNRLETVTLKGCARTRSIINAEAAEEASWDTEYLDLILNVRVVDDIQGAFDHINKHSSGHSEAIVTENYANSELFLDKVDSACVYVNASTRFTDGGEFGLGAEVGISTEKVHSRGPMGAYDLTTTKYKVYGNGQIR